MYLNGSLLPNDAVITQTITTPTINIRITRGFTYTPYIDEMRISNNVRYPANNFTPPTVPVTADATLLVYIILKKHPAVLLLTTIQETTTT